MKKNNFSAMLITGMLIAVGAIFLSGAMAFAQDKEVETEIIELEQEEPVITRESEVIRESEINGIKMVNDVFNWNGVTICFISVEGNTHGTAQEQKAEDMEPEEAFEIVSDKLKQIYQIDLQGSKVEMFLKTNEETENASNIKNANVRYYEGGLKYSEEVNYGFKVNSVTGEILLINKRSSYETDSNDESILYYSATDEEIAKVQDEYYKLVENFVNLYVDKGNVTKVYGLCPDKIGVRISMHAYCETTEGDTILVNIDQKTTEVIEYVVNPVYE